MYYFKVISAKLYISPFFFVTILANKQESENGKYVNLFYDK